MKLICFGDEHVHGENKVGEFLSKRLGISYINIGQSDTSNQKIFTTAMSFVLENLSDDMLVLVGWTNANRFDVEYEDHYFTYRPDKTDYPVRRVNMMHVSDDYIFNEKVVHGEWVSCAVSLQETFKAFGVNYYMYNTHDYIKYNDTTARSARFLDQTRYHNPINLDSSFLHWGKLRNYKDNGDTLETAAHKHWATFIHSKLNSARLL